ncbi:uncharacterized protein GGS22DRAFT_21581 [Annulohypoxylon maeteangense]|uniref:uncharacterized protein n=1 Tax=Annulohypoxylon maeteangense TaxID=1927788 RepID=UPI0020082302|nr:uncharacterized protein GGS22DRAFT_21581 [Annulohypoxylon maeteangense]KAI0884288.1 hypothetical protein GGS22DRAFT_21581 [Annulohypoxylon maeteangense]
MCLWRRVYFNCYHENLNVTVPRPVKACPLAVSRGSELLPVYCHPQGRDFTATYDFTDAVMLTIPCIPCEERQARQRVDAQWHEFRTAELWNVSPKAMVRYITRRQELFNNNYFGNWEQLQAAYIFECRQELGTRPYMYGDEYTDNLGKGEGWRGNSTK